ncbi:hypothetical protein RHMOL_Rhmol05G0144100 [Rhododendron molle]|uniref:Uncharacterized protein n=1 Tax=Rhododendron molle TaxID=49168 RepID=A0ACC0NQ84_RHOML|nr:hypothetical protein RHMOL_Rhmol05G0144100 [Rhododendron molle]
MGPRPELLQVAMVYWDPTMHVFRFYEDEMCPTVEKFQAYLRGFTDAHAFAVPPFQEDMDQLLRTTLNIPEKLSTSVIQDGELIIVRFIKLYGPEAALGDYVGQAHGHLVLSICALDAYMLIPADGRVSRSLVSVALQMGARKNIMPIVLAETLMCLDLDKNGQADSFSGCPLLLQVIAGLTSFSFYIPGHVLHQLGISQGNKRFRREHFKLPDFNARNLHIYQCSWNDRELEGPLPDSITWLESRYVKWLNKKVKARSGGYY